MSGTAWELIDLVARWVHVIAGIMWVGNSLLFNWLDRILRPAAGASQTLKPVGNVWLLHSGGFYYVEKTLLEGQPMPRPMHWFKWQAYSTWLSGMVLLIAVYWFGGRAVMADPSVAAFLTQRGAVLVGIGAVFGGWALYEAMNRFVAPRAPAVSAVIWMGGLIAFALALTRLLDGRAAFLHVGAMMGTIMAGNVVFTIVPSQRALVKSVEEGASANLKALSARAKRVSIHNNYFTFPVIVLMLSNHFPSVYGSRLSWALLLVLIAGGAAVRHVLNIRFAFPAWRPVLWATMIATVALLIVVMRAGSAMSTSASASASTAAASNAPVTFAEVRHIIDRRCTECHSATPTDPVFTTAPLGVKFDTPEEIYARMARIKERAVVTKTMPLGNKTGMTDRERELLGRWINER